MKILNNKKIIILILSVIIAFSFSFYLFTTVRADEVSLESEYLVGETINIPSKKIDGVDCSFKVFYPSGACVSEKNVTLSEAGKYVVEYEGNGKTEVTSFKVYKELYSFSGNKSTAEYGLDKSQFNTGKTGLNVSLASGEVLTFNKIIDLKALNGNSFVNFYATPEHIGTAEVQGIYFRLTDIYDEENVVTFQFKNVAYLGSSYVYSCSYVTCGHGKEAPRAYTYDSSDRVWRLRINDKFGTGAYMSLYGMAEKYDGFATKDSFCQFALDLNSSKAYISDPKAVNKEIIDLDDLAYFNNLWAGFTTGEVILSVEAYSYTGSTFHISFTDVGDYSFVNEPVLYDNEGPSIDIDLPYEELPVGLAGKSYPIFPASSFDALDGYEDIVVKAYYGVDSSKEVELNIENGKFETKYPGKYRIVYSSKDNFENETIKELFVTVLDQENPINLTLTSESVNCKQGDIVSLPEYNVSGGNGELTTVISSDKEGRLDLNKMTFIPLEEGNTVISYVSSDITGYSVKKDFVISVENNDSPVVIDNVILPKYLFGGIKYQFPEYKAYDFNENKYVSTKVYVDGDVVDGNLFTPSDEGTSEIADNYTITVEYKVNDKVAYTTDLEVIDVKYKDGRYTRYDQNQYFESNLIKNLQDDYLELLPNGGGVKYIEYAKAILFNNFQVGFSFEKLNSNSLKVILTDIENELNNVEIELIKYVGTSDKDPSKTIVAINGEETPYTLGKGGFFSNEIFSLSINNGNLIDSGNLKIDLSKVFNAEKVYVRFELDTLTSGNLKINQFCGTGVSKTNNTDQIAPIVIVKGTYPNSCDINDRITIYPIIAEDMLDTYTNALVTVYLNDEILLKDVDALVAHEIEASSYGTIYVNYNVVDGSNKARKPSFQISVVNKVDPVITISGSLNKTYHVGDTVIFPSATATDDIDSELEINYMIIPSSMASRILGEDRSYTFKNKGKHIFRAFTMDSSGNIEYSDIVFEVV